MFGRADGADIRVDDPFASSAHARIFDRGEFMYIEDMGSTNGTYLNGRQVQSAGAARRWPTRSASATANTATRSSRVALRIVEQAGRTDVGRQRTANEDSLVVRPPLFAVADGMGGAQGRRGGLGGGRRGGSSARATSGEPPEAQLAGIVRAANRRIYDLAVADESRRGHGHHAHRAPRCTATR